MIGEQVASERSERATCRSYYSCCTVLLLYCSLLHYKSVLSGFLSTWVGLLSNGVGLFSGQRLLENTPTPLSLGLRSAFSAQRTVGFKSLYIRQMEAFVVIGHISVTGRLWATTRVA